jgi:hypothetical protein
VLQGLKIFSIELSTCSHATAAWRSPVTASDAGDLSVVAYCGLGDLPRRCLSFNAPPPELGGMRRVCVARRKSFQIRPRAGSGVGHGIYTFEDIEGIFNFHAGPH